MTTAHDIIAHLERKTGHPIHGDEGIIYGDPNREADRVLVTWMATADALTEAGKRGCGLVVAHESVFYPYNARPGDEKSSETMQWPINQRRIALMEQYALTVLRLHGSMDDWTIYDDFASQLGLGAPAAGEGLVRVYALPEPMEAGVLARRMGRIMDMEAVRLAGDPRRKVSRIGLPWGGLGLFVNVGYMQKLVALGADGFIGGESDEYGMIFAAEQGIPFIETSHVLSENPGIERYARMLGDDFPGIDVVYYETPRPWRMVPADPTRS